jgi:DivIVA domain-containing protein
MLTADEIRNITFSSSMKGYKREEVDEFLDRVEADYEQIAYQI